MNEFALIQKYFKKLTYNNPSALGLNDDVFFDKKHKVVVSIDTYVEGVHFVNFRNPDLVIKKVVRSSISDLYCKGVKPKFIFIGTSGNNKSFSKKNLNLISKSLKEEQKKYDIKLSGGDTTKSKKLTFTIMSLGYSKRIIERNKCKNGDDIYVTGNIGDSYVGLQILKRKIKVKKIESDYFVNEFFKPNIQIKLTEKLLKFTNSSIDISDGLITDLEKLINKQKLKYQIFLEKIPISNYLQSLINKKKLIKIKTISRGDDYQILFTANKKKTRIIKKISKKLNVKITKIGEILPSTKKSTIIDEKGNIIRLKNKGYIHQF